MYFECGLLELKRDGLSSLQPPALKPYMAYLEEFKDDRFTPKAGKYKPQDNFEGLQNMQPKNIQVICSCGRILTVAEHIPEDGEFKCFCGLKIMLADRKDLPEEN